MIIIKILRWFVGLFFIFFVITLLVNKMFIEGIIFFIITYLILPISFFSKNKKQKINSGQKLKETNIAIKEKDHINAISESEKKKIDFLEKMKKFKKYDELGVFYKLIVLKKLIIDSQMEYYDMDFYLHRYLINDGDWIDKGEPLCSVRTKNSGNFSPILAHKSGYVEHILEPYTKLYEGQKMAKIHKENEYPKQNSIKNPDYYVYNYYTNDIWFSFRDIKWRVNDGRYIKAGEEVFIRNKSPYNEKIIDKAKKSGYIDINFNNYMGSVKYGDLLYTIRNEDNKRLKKFKNLPKIIYDDFTKSKNIQWYYVGNELTLKTGIISKSDNFSISMFFTFNFINNSDYIIFKFNPKEIKIKQNDEIHFLFDDETIIKFKVENKPTHIKNIKKETEIEIKLLLMQNELETFIKKKFKKWKIILNNENREILGGDFGLSPFYENKENLAIVINLFAKDYFKIVKKEISNYKPLELSLIEEKQDNGECYVYLMKDTVNNYYKIGISNKPKYREKTLQSEKPTIELVVAKKFPVRKIAESFEKALHDTYKEKRIRGEWFNLNEKDINDIINSLK